MLVKDLITKSLHNLSAESSSPIHSPSPSLVAKTLVQNAENLTERGREYLLQNPTSRLPNDYTKYPGKMDHTTALAVRIGGDLRNVKWGDVCKEERERGERERREKKDEEKITIEKKEKESPPSIPSSPLSDSQSIPQAPASTYFNPFL